MDKNNKSIISTYRICIMGFAILCIMFDHNSIQFGSNWRMAKEISQVGVDIFLFLSGYGLCNSFTKQPKGFYKRRFLRIIPTYLAIVIPYIGILIVFGSSTAKSVLWDYSLISFFIDGILVEWFIASILLLYLLFPIMYSIAKSRIVFISTCAVSWAIALLFYYSSLPIPNNVKVVSSIFIVRIPIFLYGIFVKIHENSIKQRTTGYYILALIISLFFIVAYRKTVNNNYWVFLRIVFFPLAISSCNILATIFDIAPDIFKIPFMQLGAITLEIYLVHEKILFLLTYSVSRFAGNINQGMVVPTLIVNVIAIILSILIGHLYMVIIKKSTLACFQK